MNSCINICYLMFDLKEQNVEICWEREEEMFAASLKYYCKAELKVSQQHRNTSHIRPASFLATISRRLQL
ncbi:hypothetical protein ACH3XW_8850 [Acanthocheilonema viteae]